MLRYSSSMFALAFVMQLFCAKVRSGMQCNYFPTSFCHKVDLKGNFFPQFFKCFQKDILRSRNANNVQISFRSSRFPPSTIRGNFIVVSLRQVNGRSYFYLLWDSISNWNQEEARPQLWSPALRVRLPSFSSLDSTGCPSDISCNLSHIPMCISCNLWETRSYMYILLYGFY